MLSFHSHLKVFVATAPYDLRANFNGLWAAAQERLGEDQKSGALFVFGNRRRNRIRILYFDATGVGVLAKRLEKGDVCLAAKRQPARGQNPPGVSSSTVVARWRGVESRWTSRLVRGGGIEKSRARKSPKIV